MLILLKHFYLINGKTFLCTLIKRLIEVDARLDNMFNGYLIFIIVKDSMFCDSVKTLRSFKFSIKRIILELLKQSLSSQDEKIIYVVAIIIN